MAVTQPNLTIDLSVDSDCSELNLPDITGDYSALTNPLGYGLPGGPSTTDVTGCEIIVTLNMLGTTLTYDFTIASDVITAATLAIGSGTGGTLSQTANLVSGTDYTITFEVINWVSGTINIVYGGISTPFTITGDGVYTALLPGGVGTDFSFEQAMFIGSIDNVFFTDAPYTSDCFTVAGTWTLTPNGALHTIGSTDELTMHIDFVDLTAYQQIIVTVVGMDGGTLTVNDGTSDIGVITKNGEYKFYSTLVTTSADYLFVPSNDFNGTITSVYVYELIHDFNIYISDLDGNVIANILSANYDRDFIRIDYDTTTLDEGCYLLNTIDPCAISGGEIITDPDFNTPSDWDTFATNGTSTVSGGKFTGQSTGGSVNAIAINTGTIPTFTGTKLLHIHFETGVIDNQADATLQVWDDGINTQMFQYNSLVPNTVYDIVLPITSSYAPFADYYNNNYTGIALVLVNGTLSGTQKMELLSYSFKLTSISSGLYSSNCFSIMQTHDCAKLVEGFQENDSTKLGFYFVNGDDFRLSARYRVLLFNPYYPIDSDDFQYSDGSRKLNYAAREKYWEVLFDYTDEAALDALTAMFECSVFQIEGISYFVRQEDFKPEWNKEGKQRLAQLRVIMRKVKSTIYNNKV
jgi:hypothetical protein